MKKRFLVKPAKAKPFFGHIHRHIDIGGKGSTKWQLPVTKKASAATRAIPALDHVRQFEQDQEAREERFIQLSTGQ